MSRELGRRPPGWSTSSLYHSGGSGPTVVNARLDLTTNNFMVLQDDYASPPRQLTRSKFDFGRPQIDQSMEWAMDAQRGWEDAANVDNGDGWVQSARYEPKSEARYSTRTHHHDGGGDDEAAATFQLNLDIPDKPYFSQNVEYESFRNRPVIPTAEDIFNDEREAMQEIYQDPSERRKLKPIPGIPINRVKGPYDNVDQYLYTHYELLRQDCLIPLQKAVKSYRKTLAKAKDNDLSTATAPGDPNPPTRDFRLYEHVRLNAVVFGSRQVLYRIGFRVPYYAKVSWPQSKRLIEGTLVLLSKDNFEKDLKIATVVMRGEEPMKGSSRFEHMIDIHLERDNDNTPLGFGDPSLSEEDTYVMLEATDGYFEAYRHILSVFQTIPSDDLPFSEYLVDVSQNVRLPHYAAVKRHYDIAMYPAGKRRMSEKAKPVDITKIWPRYEIGMDSTQMDALKTILSNNVAIVQGPPGTGKTFVGTYAMRVLLNNFPHSIGPIVCICQTNHALDQFLEHIYNHEEKIVRVGGRSKSEILKDRLLYELRKEQERKPGFGRLIGQRKGVEKAITEMLREMYEEPCVDLEFLRKIKALNPRQLDSLKRLGEMEEKRAKVTAAATKYTAFDDDDDDWVTSTPSPQPQSPSPRKSRNRNERQAKSSQNDWDTGNTNYAAEKKEKNINPVEIWLHDAIEYVDGSSPMYDFTEEMKEDLLEQNRGLVFEDENDEEDLADEEELREITLNFAEEPDLRGNKSTFINIGRAYKKQWSESPTVSTMYSRLVEGNRAPAGTERKIINYKKIQTAKTFNTDEFNFFENAIDESVFEPQHYVLERWMKEEDDVTLWPLPVRLKAHKKWAELRNREYTEHLKELMKRYENVCKEIRRFNMLSDARTCRENRVIGMTSTAAAKYHDLLEQIRPRIMVVEEAAEMMEAHIVSAVTKSLQHLILIGDHQQLRPQNAVHALAEKHFLNVSLFERLVMNEIPFTRLSHQRRMRPEIRMFVDPIYSDPPLQDHDDVKDPAKRPPVRGVEQSVFFLSHNEPESHVPETASKCNEHEAAMAAKLSRYLLLQGYSPEEITIITMYSGQRSMIKRQLRQERTALLDTSLIQVSSVDGYQGEENKIIILSLVRSNAQGQIGFLKVANRVCVSLSRAKEGMYILGNASLLCERSDLWNEIIGNLEDNARERIGTRLKLQCKKHSRVTEVQWPVDFAPIPEGGCTRDCGEILECGHRCPLPCHAYNHEDVRCEEPCERIFPECKHACQRRCFESCGVCIQKIKLLLPCGHEIEGECGKLRISRHCPICLK